MQYIILSWNVINHFLAFVWNETPLKPKGIVIDFELGVINVINWVFNGVQIQGCNKMTILVLP
jgi:hypothetical protein